MQTALLASALVMGLAGGPHCVAMCGAACAGVIRIVRMPQAGAGTATAAVNAPPVAQAFHAGRVLAYAAAGALAATAAESLALASEQVAVLRPLWVLLHVFVLVWGLLLAGLGHQPVWASRAGRALAARMASPVGSVPGMLALGALWVCMPCGLLYSALMLASLANGPAQGALAMTLFAVGSGAWLLLAPWLWRRLGADAHGVRQRWGTRLAGALLAAMALHALWTDLGPKVAQWCGLD